MVENDGKVRGFVDVYFDLCIFYVAKLILVLRYDILSYLLLTASQGRDTVTMEELKEAVKNYVDVFDAFRVGNLVSTQGFSIHRFAVDSPSSLY